MVSPVAQDASTNPATSENKSFIVSRMSSPVRKEDPMVRPWWYPKLNTFALGRLRDLPHLRQQSISTEERGRLCRYACACGPLGHPEAFRLARPGPFHRQRQ